MDHNESDLDGNLSNAEEEEDDSEMESAEDEDDSEGGEVADLAHGIKLEDAAAGFDAESMMARLKRQQVQEERAEIEREIVAMHHLQQQQQRLLPRDVLLPPRTHTTGSPPALAGLAQPPPLPPTLSLASAFPALSNNASLSPPAPPGSHHSDANGASSGWSFDEPFKQARCWRPHEATPPPPPGPTQCTPQTLYELSDDPKRKEFLDDLFGFMQKRGTPVNRIPIMAKQVLDLYELYNLVTARGGLVEVINKKIWREITKGLNLPSSITSAAFTLRTQYMKYLYPYECEKKKMSTPVELQAAIDGNRREGRRSSYGTYADMVARGANSQMSPLSLVTAARQVNGNGLAHSLSSGDEDSVPTTPTHPSSSSSSSVAPQREALNLEVSKAADQHGHHGHHRRGPDDGPPAKRGALADDDQRMPSAHVKITSRGDGRSDGSSLVVTMDINGITYQGVLFAQSRGGRLA